MKVDSSTIAYGNRLSNRRDATNILTVKLVAPNVRAGLAVLFLALASCKSDKQNLSPQEERNPAKNEPAARSPVAPTTTEDCPPFTVTVDGEPDPRPKPQIAIGEVINGEPAVAVIVHWEDYDCSVESLRVSMADALEEDDPGIRLFGRGDDVSVGMWGTMTGARGSAPSAIPSKGETVSVCIRDAKPITPFGGPYEGRTVKVNGKAVVPFCGERGKLELHPPGG